MSIRAEPDKRARTTNPLLRSESVVHVSSYEWPTVLYHTDPTAGIALPPVIPTVGSCRSVRIPTSEPEPLTRSDAQSQVVHVEGEGGGDAEGARELPYCGGVVMAIDVESARSLFCLRICLLSKRKFSCTRCSRRLVSTIYDQ
uniref:Uncharacterized protein n=1 Tax=Ananas comosus var. bracteatus TaxID=296719 RepID=A0A6V7QBC8_ANACO|nr:unnamed protein product [Ananas comosus var. bracteatus]